MQQYFLTAKKKENTARRNDLLWAAPGFDVGFVVLRRKRGSRRVYSVDKNAFIDNTLIITRSYNVRRCLHLIF